MNDRPCINSIYTAFNVLYSLLRDIVDVILKNTEPKDWKNDQIFSKKTLTLLVEKMPGKDDAFNYHEVCRYVITLLILSLIFVHIDVAEYVLNKCIKPTKWTYGSPDCEVEFEFDLLKGYV